MLLYEQIKTQLMQNVIQAGLQPVDIEETLDTVHLTRKLRLAQTLATPSGRPRAKAIFSFEWSASDTAISEGTFGPGLDGVLIDLTCTLEYHPLADYHTVHVKSLDGLRAFLRTFVDKLPTTFKEEGTDNKVEVSLLMGEGDDVLLFGPIRYRVSEWVDLGALGEADDDGDEDDDDHDDEDEDDEDDEFDEDYNPTITEFLGDIKADSEEKAYAFHAHMLEAAMAEVEEVFHNATADALRGLMALDALKPPDELFAPVIGDVADEHEHEHDHAAHDDEEAGPSTPPRNGARKH